MGDLCLSSKTSRPPYRHLIVKMASFRQAQIRLRCFHLGAGSLTRGETVRLRMYQIPSQKLGQGEGAATTAVNSPRTQSVRSSSLVSLQDARLQQLYCQSTFLLLRPL